MGPLNPKWLNTVLSHLGIVDIDGVLLYTTPQVVAVSLPRLSDALLQEKGKRMAKVRGCVVFLTLSAILSLTANAQTQAQIDKKNAADLAQMSCNDVKGKCVSEREFAIFTKDEASYWRTQCVNAGATPAQLDPGDSHAHAGNASLGFGDTDRNVGDNYWSTAEVAKAAGDTFWRAGDFVGACIQYDISTPNHDTAKGWYDSALNWYQQATTDYAVALNHYETLYQELTMQP